jgi:hypothetical protein
MLNI